MKRVRILVVDDEEFNLKILVTDLQNNGYETVQAMNGKIACDILKNDNLFDVILLDRLMPEMNGIQVMEVIKNDVRLKDIPVIMVTAAATKQDILEGIKPVYSIILPSHMISRCCLQ